MLALDPERDVLYVGRSMMAVNPPQRIGIVRRSDMDIEELDVFFPRPHALAVGRGGTWVYTASLVTNQIAGIEVGTNEIELATLPGNPHVFVQFALSPDGRTMVGCGQLTNAMLVFDVSTPATPTLTRTVDVNPSPWHPVFSPDGRYVYYGNLDANTITVVETAGWTVDGVIQGRGIAEPHGSAVSPDGRYLYVSNRNVKSAYRPRRDFGDNTAAGTVVVINTETRAIEKVLEVEEYPAGMSTRTSR
jgi:DNA-binding beta-propeller fold protein YncE